MTSVTQFDITKGPFERSGGGVSSREGDSLRNVQSFEPKVMNLVKFQDFNFASFQAKVIQSNPVH